ASNYQPSTPTPVWPEVLAADLQSAISPDSLKAYILQLASFKTRNSGSDTVSATEGFGAARRWAHQKFREFSNANGGR
ncbi:MAG TPA: hypothetical protein DCF33_02985, partial [Saprospirales bacterium]|nr:hypothetical protein [Saprospirales bacterium]